jgi:hypothetical protein
MPDRLTDQIAQLVEKWRREGAMYDAFHATMGTGWKACADELAALLTPQETK